MAQADELRVGDRLKLHRLRRNKTQAAVAGLAGVSEDYLSQIERGLKTPTLGLLCEFARILGVHVSQLLDEPRVNEPSTVHPAAHSLRRALLTYDDPRHSDALAIDWNDLRCRVNEAWKTWQTSPSRFTDGAHTIPDLVVVVQRAAWSVRTSNDSDTRRRAARLMSDLLFLVRTFARRIGSADLALLAADRAVTAAYEADDELRIAAAHWNLGHALLALGEPEGAEEAAIAAAEKLKAKGNDGPDALALYGSLWLVAAVAAVRRGNAWTARERLREQALPAARKTGEGNVMWTVFGPTNVNMHAMSIEMESGEASAGLDIADTVDITGSPSRERRMTYSLELARLYDQRRDDGAVLIHLMNAEASGPEDLPYNPLARELTRSLLRRARPSLAPHVRTLAGRVGLLPS